MGVIDPSDALPELLETNNVAACGIGPDLVVRIDGGRYSRAEGEVVLDVTVENVGVLAAEGSIGTIFTAYPGDLALGRWTVAGLAAGEARSETLRFTQSLPDTIGSCSCGPAPTREAW